MPDVQDGPKGDTGLQGGKGEPGRLGPRGNKYVLFSYITLQLQNYRYHNYISIVWKLGQVL